MINITENEIKIDIGEITEIAGDSARLSLETATKDIIDGEIDVLVTCPINKQNVFSDTFNYSGHTEYFRFHKQRPITFYVDGSRFPTHRNGYYSLRFSEVSF